MIRTGLGYDIHLLEEGGKLILGGVEIPGPLGSVGHSDADTLIHAVIDAVLGAAGLGDIGDHFPPSDPAYRGVSSRKLLSRIMDLLDKKGYRIINVDTIIILEKPKIFSYKETIRENLAADLRLDVDAVSVKAKTKEGIDASGEGRAVEAHAIALIESADR